MPAGALAGLCPACLLAQGAETKKSASGEAGRFVPPPVEDLAKLFPQLEIISLLGAGGMGAVYKARQPALDRLVALKILPSKGAEEAKFEERFNREARALARLSHPNVVAVHEFGQAGRLRYFIMEFVDGANLRQLEQAGRLSPREALQIIPQICDALQYAHDEGVVHRDIKPENVLVDRKGRVKIADFGLAKILGVEAEALRLTAEGQVMGTPHYMAPEQLERPLAVDHRADIYSLGVVFYEMLTGDLPLGKFAPPSRKVQVDMRLDEVVLRALENDPERRYQRANEVKTQVEDIANTPAPSVAAVALQLERAQVRWVGFPLLARKDHGHALYWKGILQALAVLFAVFTIGFGLVSVFTGRSAWGWLGIVGWPSVLVRLGIAALLTAFGVWMAWRAKDQPAPPQRLPQTPQGTLILSPGRLSGKAVVGACWAAMFLMAAFLYFTVHTVTRVSQDGVGEPEPSTRWWQIVLSLTVLPLGVTAPIGVTILGWLAVGDIRRSQGRISGLPLALFDGLLFPLIPFNGLLVWAWITCVHAVAESSGESPLGSPWPAIAHVGAVILCLVASTALLRRVWRAVRPSAAPTRSSQGWWWSRVPGGVALGLLCAVIIGVVAYRQGQTRASKFAPQQVAQRDARSGHLIAKLPGRGTVELLAVGEPDAALNGWWSAAGIPQSNALYEVRGGIENRSTGRVTKELLFRILDLPDGASSGRVEAEPECSGSSGGSVFENGRELRGGWQVCMSWPPAVQTASIFLAYGLDPWRTIATHSANSQSQGQVRLPDDPQWTVNFHHAPSDTQDGAQIAVVFGPEDKNWIHRMVAVDTNGVEHGVDLGNGTPIERLILWTYTFRRLPLRAVKEFRLQVRPVYWVEFPDVAVVPRQPLPSPKRLRFSSAQEHGLGAAIDVDSGKVQTLTLNDGDRPWAGLENAAAQLQKDGIDWVVGAGELRVFQMDFVVLANADWDNLPPHEMIKNMYRSYYHPNEVKPLKEGQLPATFGFRTNKKKIGMLQLLPTSQSQTGPMMRYKLIAYPALD